MTQPPRAPGPPPRMPWVGEVQNGYQWNGRQWVPYVGPNAFIPGATAAPPPKKPWYKEWWAIAIGVVAVLALLANLLGGGDKTTPASPTPSTQQTTAPASEATTAAPTEQATAPTADATTAPPPAEPPAAPVSKFGQYPADESMFIDGVAATAETYRAAETDLQKAKILNDRNRTLLASGEVSNWVGILKDVSANSEGKAIVSIQIADNIHVATWNNAFSDMIDDTLIPESSPLYDVLLTMKPGQRVVFSGTFVGRDDAVVYPTNVTEYFSATKPEFLFRFSAVAPN